MSSPVGAIRALRLMTFSTTSQTLLTNVANMALGLLTGILTARALQPEGRGLLVGLVIWVATISTFAVLGVDEGLVHTSRGHVERARAIRLQLNRVLLGQAFAGSLLTIAVCASLIHSHATAGYTTVLLLAPIVPCNLYNQMLLAEHRVAGNFGRWNLVRLIPSSTYAALVGSAFLADQLTVTTAAGALGLGSIVTTAVCRVSLRRSTPVLIRSSDPSDVQRFGRGLLFATLPMMANQRLDQLLLSILATPSVLALYAVAVSIASLLQVIGTTLEQVLFPRLARGSTLDIRRILLVSTSGLVVLAAGMTFFASEIITVIYGSAYASAAHSLALLAFGSVATVISYVLIAEAKAAGRLKHVMRSQIVGLAVTASMLPILTYKLGVAGAAVTSLLAYSSVALSLLYLRKGSAK